jgi:hypothetical protein
MGRPRCPRETRTGAWVLRSSRGALDIADFYPGDAAGPIDAIPDHRPGTTVAALRAEGGIRALRVSRGAIPIWRSPRRPEGGAHLQRR